ncbi:MAG TPA: pitrilysin family protein [Longimicrobiales bacterium]
MIRQAHASVGRSTTPGRLQALQAACALLAACSAAVLPRPASAQDGPDLPVIEHVLPNGMRFLVLRREGAPTVAFVTQYRVGAVQERPGETGIAHLLEHMLFKGTTTIGTRDHAAELALFPRIDAVQDSIRALRAQRAAAADTTAQRAADGRGDTSCGPAPAASPASEDPRIERLTARLEALEDSARAFVVANEFDRILTRNGARGLNATTTYEATTYYVELPANRARLWFALEADRLRNPVLREFYTERDVVAEERRMRVESDPGGRLWECFLATAFQVHPYGRPVVGTMEDIQNFTRRQAEEYFRRYYGPNNAVVAVVGDVQPDSIVAWAERYLGTIPRGEDARRVDVREPEQRGERRVTVTFDAEPQLLMGWHVPEPDHPDYPALEVLAHMLTGGNTSRLHRRLILEERAASAVSASLQPGGLDPQLFVIGAAPAGSGTVADLERLIDEEIARLQAEPPTDSELERIRNQLEAGEVRRLRSNLGLAFQLAGSASAYDGDWRATFRYTQRLLAVEAADVQRVARTYFRPENRTVAILVSTKERAGEEAQ